jgi:hypothetical protein
MPEQQEKGWADLARFAGRDCLAWTDGFCLIWALWKNDLLAFIMNARNGPSGNRNSL